MPMELILNTVDIFQTRNKAFSYNSATGVLLANAQKSTLSEPGD
jgi:hypothetical protein